MSSCITRTLTQGSVLSRNSLVKGRMLRYSNLQTLICTTNFNHSKPSRPTYLTSMFPSEFLGAAIECAIWRAVQGGIDRKIRNRTFVLGPAWLPGKISRTQVLAWCPSPFHPLRSRNQLFHLLLMPSEVPGTEWSHMWYPNEQSRIQVYTITGVKAK